MSEELLHRAGHAMRDAKGNFSRERPSRVGEPGKLQTSGNQWNAALEHPPCYQFELFAFPAIPHLVTFLLVPPPAFAHSPRP
jgi:hypothetical protein